MRMLSAANIEHSNETGLKNKEVYCLSEQTQPEDGLQNWLIEKFNSVIKGPDSVGFSVFFLYTMLISSQPFVVGCAFLIVRSAYFSVWQISTCLNGHILVTCLFLNLRHETALRPKSPTLETERVGHPTGICPVWRSETKWGFHQEEIENECCR